ncbi:MAG: hypothetical protein COB20_06445 [SAR86 cluster bacterium]|uniref:Uncharacterized protein n=1 Tax=SAR86 cluster bacterium TaxID=2030880 RepID=A0A2A4X935_9GAMM|nr:MAG: hypothetical protein COB20_06445 [SAR86 cluster bacterium]
MNAGQFIKYRGIQMLRYWPKAGLNAFFFRILETSLKPRQIPAIFQIVGTLCCFNYHTYNQYV